MKQLLVAAFALLLVSAAAPLPAQTPAAGAGQIRGTVVDAENSAPVGAASVAVWSAADSALVAGAIARPDGTFVIEGLRPGTYYLRVSMIGYGAHTTPTLSIEAAAPRASAGTVRLTRRAIALEGVEITAERPTVTIAPDRNSYRASEVAPGATSASEILEAVPSVQVDSDGKVSLRGNENVVVQINGRPSPIRGDQLAAYLKQLPAGAIERVEVIPNPSAKYDPEGMAGIINLALKQNVDLGLSGGLTLAAATGSRYNASGNLGYQQGPLTLFLTYGYHDDERKQTGLNHRTRLDEHGAPFAFTEQGISGNVARQGHNLSASADYRLNQRDVLSTSLTLNRRESSDGSLSAYHELDGGRDLTDRYDRLRDATAEARMVDYGVAFKRTLAPQRHELSAELRFNQVEDDERTGLWRQAPGAAARTEAEIDELDARTWQFTVQLDYTRALAERTKLETGYKGNTRRLERDFSVRTDSLGSGEWRPSALSNDLELDERVDAVYAVLGHGTGRFELQAGLRAEHASRDFALADGEHFPHDYTSFFPSGLVSYQLGESTDAKLSYSRRIRRPGTWELNPFPVFMDLQNVFFGNPELAPEYTDAVELGLQHRGALGSVQLAPFYRRTTDIIRFIVNTADTVAGREVTSVSFRNLDVGTSWGTDVNGTLRLGQRFNGLASVNVFKMVTDGSGAESSLSSDAVTWSARLNGTLNLTSATALQAMYFYRAPMNIERGRFSSVSMTNLALRHKLPGDKATVTLRVVDPFQTMRFRVEAGDDRVIQLTEQGFNSRSVHLGVQYTFGRAPRMRQPRPEAEPESRPGFGQ